MQRFHHLVQAGFGGLRDLSAAHRKRHLAQLIPTAAHSAGQQRKGRGDCFNDQIDDQLENNRPDRKLRVIEGALNRQIDVNHAVAIREQGHGELHGQTVGGALYLVAKADLVEHDVVGGRELAVGLDQVFHIHTELAALDAMACVFHAVGRERRELQIAHFAGDIQRQRFGQRVELAQNFQLRRALGFAAQFQRCHLNRAVLGLR